MNPMIKDNQLLRRYLLGEVTEQERDQVEQQLMTDREYFNHFLKTEESLIDEYVNGELSEDEKEPFEIHFLSAPERRDKLEFSKSLNRYVAERGSSKATAASAPYNETSGWRSSIAWLGQTPARTIQVSLVVVILILVAGMIVLLADNARSRARIQQQAVSTQAETDLKQLLGEQIKRNEELARELEESRNEASRIRQELDRIEQKNGRRQESGASRIASLVLVPGSVRDKGQTSRVSLSNEIKLLNLELKLYGQGYQSYQVEVKTVEGKSLWRDGKLTPRGRSGERVLVAGVPSTHLPEGDYLITLSAAVPGGGHQDVATYYFTILRD